MNTLTELSQKARIRRASERGLSQIDWLKSYHTFSFNEYHDPNYTQFSCLRVMNDDTVSPSGGFHPHGHKDMEIITYVLKGQLQHKDSLGNGSMIEPGELQRMSAGTGITHSEFNPSETCPAHFYQIWILPNQQNLTPSYEQKPFHPDEKRGLWCLLASSDAREGSVLVHQDLSLYSRLFDASELGQAVTYDAKEPRSIWLQVLQGKVSVDGETLGAGDGASWTSTQAIQTSPVETETEVLLFDLPIQG